MEEGIMFLLLKHHLETTGTISADTRQKRRRRHPREKQQEQQFVSSCLPDTNILIDQCRKHFALVTLKAPGQRGNGDRKERALTATATLTTIARVLRGAAPLLGEEGKADVMKQLVAMTLDNGCPAALAQELLEVLVVLADGDPAKILQVYASRLCFYCDSQSDPCMQDQVAEVAGMIRALEYFTRVLFKGGQSDLCAQFLYADLSSNSIATPFSPHLSEEELNDLLLCGRKDYPHVAQLINGCLISRLTSVRRSAYETLSNVAMFAKAHRGTKAFDMLLRLRLGGVEKDPGLVTVLASLAWLVLGCFSWRDVANAMEEIVFVDQNLQETRLVGSGAPGSYGLLDDLFSESPEVRLVAFHSVNRLLFHDWILGTTESASLEEEPEGEGKDADARKVSEAFPLGSSFTSLPPRSENNSGADEGLAAVPACAEQALLRVCLILHEHTTSSATNRNKKRRFDPRFRAVARTLATELRSRRRLLRARQLLIRSALLVVDHGLANGSLDGLRERFPTSPPPSPSPPPPPQLTVRYNLQSGRGLGGGTDGGVDGYDGLRNGDDDHHRSGDSHDGGGYRARGELEVMATTRPSKDTLQYASALHFLVEMLCEEDRRSVTRALRLRFDNYFNCGDDTFWDIGDDGEGRGRSGSCYDESAGKNQGEADESWSTMDQQHRRDSGEEMEVMMAPACCSAYPRAGDGGIRRCDVNARAVAAWLADGVDAGCSSLLADV